MGRADGPHLKHVPVWSVFWLGPTLSVWPPSQIGLLSGRAGPSRPNEPQTLLSSVSPKGLIKKWASQGLNLLFKNQILLTRSSKFFYQIRPLLDHFIGPLNPALEKSDRTLKSRGGSKVGASRHPGTLSVHWKIKVVW
jgi:hypothetical protein